MTESLPIFQKVIDRLATIGRPRPALGISPETEIYYDLGIYGDVLYFDLIDWAHREFGTSFEHFDLGAYAPGERGFLAMIWRRRRREADRRRGRYRSFKVRDLVEAIESKAWPPGRRFEH
jgi:hypothetical protein